MRIELRGESEVAVEIGPAQPAPFDWNRWRDALCGGAPTVENYTRPEGWSVTLAETATATGIRVHAFYSIFDRAVYAHADVAPDFVDHARTLFLEAHPIFDDEIAALADL
jgi:hypothetical protein